MSLKLNLINSKSFFYRKILGWCFLCLCFFSLLLIGGRYNFFQLNFAFSLIAVCSFIFFGFLGVVNIISNHFPYRGYIFIDEESIQCTTNEVTKKIQVQDMDEVVFKFDDLKYKPSKNRNLTNGGGNNFLIINHLRENYIYEFFIESKDQEKELLGLIEKLKIRVCVKIEKAELPKWRSFFG